MRDSLDLFDTLINWKKKNYIKETKQMKESLLFENVAIILFLNKEDLFDQKIRTSSLKVCFEDFNEDEKNDVDSMAKSAKEFIARKFVEVNKTNVNRSKRDIYWHYTYALDRKNVETVVASVKDKILKYMLESMRL